MPVGGNYSDDSQHRHKVIMLNGGLDLVTPPLFVEPGRLIDCLNYECVDKVGYKRIEGFERYDGGGSPSASRYWQATTDEFVADPAYGPFEAYGISAGSTGTIVVIGNDGNNYVTNIVYYTQFDNDGLWALTFNPIAGTVAGANDAYTARLYFDNNPTAALAVEYNQPSGIGPMLEEAEDNLATLISNADTVRNEIDALPGNVFAHGLQYYKNRVVALADCQYIYLAYDTTATVTPPATAHYFYVGSNLTAGTYDAVILDWKWLRGNFEDLGSSSGTRAWAKVLVRPTDATGTFSAGDDCFLDTTGTGVSGTNYWSAYSAISGVSGAPAASDDEPVWGGVLYKGIDELEGARTSNNDWTQVDMGYEVYFNGGNSTIIPRELTLSTTQSQLDEEGETVTSVPTPSLTDSFENISGAYINNAAAASFPAGAEPNDAEALDSALYTLDTDDNSGVFATYTVGSPSQWGDGGGIVFKNFGLSIPEGAIVRRVRFTGKVWSKSASPILAVPFASVELVGVSGSTVLSFPVTVPNTATSGSPYDISLGDPTGKWGLPELLPATLNSSAFGVKIKPQNISNSGGFIQYLMFDTFEVEVDYFVPTGKLYFYDASSSSEIETKLVRIHLDKGTWADGTAEGVAHIYDPELLDTTPTRNYIKIGDAIRLTSGGSPIATVTAVKASLLPSHGEVVASDRRVQMHVANYFLNPDWDTIYGCTGLGRAFSYDNRYFRKIYSAYDSQLDKPRHITSYRNYLVMGYESGNVLLSKVGESGPEPENFDPLQGAREFSFVDRVVGLSELADTSLGVFCSQSINRIVFNPNASSSGNLFYTSSISPNAGAIEYTVAAFGPSTLFCDQYGIRSVEQTDVYGDFIGRPMSHRISPWLRGRLSPGKYWQDSRTTARPLFAHTLRAKNQYRVWFDDGYVLCLNMNTEEEGPQFTVQRYGMWLSSVVLPVTPVCHSSVIDDRGKERTCCGQWGRKAGAEDANNDPAHFVWVFELERGWSFDGRDFPARLTINLSYLEEPFDYDQIRKIEIHGVDYNNTTLFAGFGTKYGEEVSYTGMSLGSTYTPAGRNAAGAVSADYTPWAKIVNCATRGRPLYMKIKNSSTATGGEATSAIEPPHILQALLVHYNPARTEN